MLHDSISEIQRYAEAVEKGQVGPIFNRCPLCQEEAEGFSRHDRRKRSFLVVIQRVVHEVKSWITRWKCPLCSHRFTLYPPFALPHKRYVKETIFELARAHLEQDELSYRQAVRVDGMPLFRGRKDDGSIDNRSLWHSTLHRWHAFFAALAETVREALKLVREKSATSDFFRRVYAVASRKYRSETRKTVLVAALKTLSVEREFRFHLSRSIFPELATACSWR
jgi:hypothetical protein